MAADLSGPLPQAGGGRFLTDGGIETVLIYQHGRSLPEFAAFPLLAEPAGSGLLRRYYREHLDVAAREGTGFVLEAPTWRASRNWGERLGYTEAQLDEFNRQAVGLLVELRHEYEASVAPIVVSGCIGPQADAYFPDRELTAGEAQSYHAAQVQSFARTPAQLVCAMTITYADEAIGVAGAGAEAGLPVVISFTVETDGRLPSGMPLGEAIDAVDAAAPGAVAYYMINCAHPTHFADVLTPGAPWLRRIRGLRANASALSHAELDNAETLDSGDPQDLARHYAALGGVLDLAVVGGCCGTDVRHIAAIAEATRPPSPPRA